MTPIVVAGIGSPFGADQIAWMVIDALHADYECHDTRIKLIKLDRPATELLMCIRGVDQAVIVDAIQGGWEKGRIIRLQREDIDGSENFLSSHGFGLTATLNLGKQLQLLPRELRIIGLEVTEDINWEPQAQQVTELAHAVKAELAGFRIIS